MPARQAKQNKETTDQLKLVEIANIEKLREILTNPTVYPNDRVRLAKYISRSKDNSVEVTYERKTYNGNHYGRYYAKADCGLCAQYMWRKVRATGFSNACVDIDAVNCHPVITLQLYESSTGKRAEALRTYVERRDEIIAGINVPAELIERYNFKAQDAYDKKDFVKKMFVIALYGGAYDTFARSMYFDVDEFPQPEFHKQFEAELREIARDIIAIKDDHIQQLITDIKAEKGNAVPIRKIMALIIQDLETRLIMTAINEYTNLKSSRGQICAYTYDGFIIAGAGNNADAICREISDLIREKFRYDVKFISKPFGDPVEPAPRQHHWTVEPTEADRKYYDFNRFFETEYKDIYRLLINSTAFIKNGAGGFWVFKIYNPQMRCYMINEVETHLIPKKFLLHYKTYRPKYSFQADPNDYTKSGKDANNIYLLTMLNNIKDIVCYDIIGFNPNLNNTVGDGIYNIFTGFATKPRYIIDELDGPALAAPDMEHLEPLLDHIYKHLCAGSRSGADYVLNWLAHIVQKPDIKTGTILYFVSSRGGVGKNMIFEEFFGKKILGAKYVQCKSSRSHAESRFNAEDENKLLLIFDEFVPADTEKFISYIKSKTTSPTTSIEAKGVDRREVPDFSNLMFFGNSIADLKIDAGDRRFTVFDANVECANDVKYWTKMAAYLQDDRTAAEFAQFLYTRDISAFKPSDLITTDTKNLTKIIHEPNALKFLLSLALSPDFNEMFADNGEFMATRDELYNMFTVWCGRQNINNVRVVSKPTFGIQVHEGGRLLPKARINNKRLFKVNREELHAALSGKYGFDITTLPADFD